MLSKLNSHLPYFVAVATRASFSKAAEDVALTQSALSYQIKTLEQKLGFQVFTRGKGTKVELTTKGQALLTEYQQLEKRFNQLLGDIQILPHKKRIKISAPVDFGVKLLTPLLAEFEAAGLMLDLHLDDEVVDLKHSEYDLAIRNNTRETNVCYVELATVNNHAFCSESYAQRHGLQSTAQIKDEHRLIVRNTTHSHSWQSVLAPQNLAFSHHANKQLISNSFGILQSVLAHHGIGILPQYFLTDALISAHIKVLEGQVAPTKYYLAFQESTVAEKWALNIKAIVNNAFSCD